MDARGRALPIPPSRPGPAPGPSLFNVTDLVAFITGGGTATGLMFARLLVDKGAARVYLGGRREQFLQKAIENIGNPKIAAVKCDVMNKDSLRAAADFVERDAGFLNLLICGAGLSGPEPAHLDDHTTLEEWAQGNFAADFQGYVDTFAANVAAPWYTTMAFLKLLDLGNKKQNLLQNSQVLITSPYAAFDRVASAGWAYCQSKTAATLAANQLARVLPQWDIRANCIAPGIYPAELAGPNVYHYVNDLGECNAVPISVVPLGDYGEETDLASALLYLASMAGAFLNGTTVVLDRGNPDTFPLMNHDRPHQ